jgi:hypothetical protein
MGLRQIAEGLWTAEDELRLPGGVRLPIRATIVVLPAGELLVHSPTPLGADLAAAVERLGRVAHLVAPNLLHHVSLSAWLARFPQARVWAVPGLERKRRDIPIAGLLDGDGDTAPPWAAHFAPRALAGCPGLRETVFFHAASRTLVCSDLLFNVRDPRGWATKLVLTLAGTRGRFAMSRAWRRYAADRAALSASLRRMLEWPFTRVIVGHGDVLEADDAPARVRAAISERFTIK